MNILGITLESNKANLVILKCNDKNITLVKTKTTKITLENEEVQQNIEEFRDKIKEYLKDNNIELIGIKKRNQTGKFSGGAVSFKMEALIQLSNVPVRLISATAISKKCKNLEINESLFKYQIDAYKTAYYLCGN